MRQCLCVLGGGDACECGCRLAGVYRGRTAAVRPHVATTHNTTHFLVSSMAPFHQHTVVMPCFMVLMVPCASCEWSLQGNCCASMAVCLMVCCGMHGWVWSIVAEHCVVQYTAVRWRQG